MRLLLDTHFLIWLVNQPGSISQREYALMARREGPLIVSTITIWELRMKWRSLDRHGKPKGDLSPECGLDFAERNGFTLAPLNPSDCTVEVDPPISHKDPFDEMLLAQAQRLGAKLLTRDTKLLDHPLAISA
ncbi:type II toxin-antitoxin system VapC family toxin [Sphingomonas sp. GB1N7]|uniref:type II toxin-antitoxin system VapC family toxin n=1 Tax=Parasphingomonas caseinilytica TaxID=3096158 RepID=UPI002FCC059C